MSKKILQFLASALFFLILGINFQSVQAQVYFSENFNGNSIPAGWTVQDQGTGACKWMIHAPYTNNGTDITMLGSNFLFVNSDSAGFGTIANETITSPIINANSGGNSVFLEFSHYFRNLTGDSDTGFVQVFDGAAWLSVRTITSDVGTGINPTLEKINITPFLNPNLRIRLRYVGNYAWWWALDNIRILTPAPNDAGVIKIEPGQTNCGSLPNPYNVSIRVVNFGGNPLSNCPVSYRVNGGTPVTQTIPGPIAPGDTILVNFSTPFVPAGNQNYLFEAYTNLSGDLITDNDSSSLLFKALPTGLNIQNFAGYTGDNLNTVLPGWTEASGLIPVTGGFSAWRNSDPQQITLLGTTAAKVNLYSNFQKAWLITEPLLPKANSVLKFDLAMTTFNGTATSDWGSDDSLKVRVSTNCGQTWNTIRSFYSATPLSNVLQKQTVSLSAYANQVILIGFYGTDGTTDDTPDFDLHLTNMEILVPSANDLAASAIVGYDPTCLAEDPFTVKVRVLNNGTQTQNSINLSYSINGQAPVSQTFTQPLNSTESAVFTFTTPVTLPLQTNNLLKVWTSLSGDSNNINDTIKNFRLDKPATDFGLVNFNGFNGDNIGTLYPGWREAGGANPTGTTSGWINSNPTQTTFYGSTTAKANIFSSSLRNWLISPPVIPQGGAALRFKMGMTTFANTDSSQLGGDDTLAIRYSSDCGQTWNFLKTFTIADNIGRQLREQTVYLSGLSGQKIQIGFYASSGVVSDGQDVDLHIDDIQLIIPANKDIGVSALVLPAGTCGLPDLLPLTVKITNFGAQAQSNFPVSYSLNGQSPVTENFTGNIGAGAVADFSFSGVLNLSNQPTNILRVWTSLSGDVSGQNDTLNQQLAVPPSGLPVVDFNTYTGSNLNTLNPGWREFSTGTLPSATSSSWINTSNFQNSALGSPAARVSIFSNAKREWIAGPVFRVLANSVVKFKAAVVNRGGTTADAMGADDSVNVMVSTNCGLTWSRVFAVTASNNLPPTFTPFSVPLSSFEGQRIQIAFFATEGNVSNPQDYDFILDEINAGITTGIVQEMSEAFVLYPNPSDGIFRMRMNQQAAASGMEVINMLGQKVQAGIQKISEGEWQLNLSGQPKGVYKLIVRTAEGSVSQTLLVK